MKKNSGIMCPVSAERVNENVVRIIAAYTIILIALSIYLDSYIISSVVLIDFALRAFNSGKHSILKELAIDTGKTIGVKRKWTDAAPKKFAALLGFVFTFIIVSAQLLHLNFLIFPTAAILIFCALLESAFGICLGCYVYHFIKTISIKKSNY